MKLVIGNDNGNSTQKIMINGEFIEQPNVFTDVYSLPGTFGYTQIADVISNIYDNMVVSITSEKLNNSGLPRTCYVGQYAIDEASTALKTMDIGERGEKTLSDNPIISTLSIIAGYAIKKAYEEKKDIEKLISKTINVDVDMATALPVTQYNNESKKIFEERFLGTHNVVFYLTSTTRVTVNINIGYVNTLPEAQPAVFYLKANHGIEELKKYNFSNKKILHVAIGEGTTEYPLTKDILVSHGIGSNNGVGLAVEEIVDTFRSRTKINNISRQELIKILRNKENRYNGLVSEMVQLPLKRQADEILKMIYKQLSNVKNDVDYIIVYGGGSIFMKDYLKEILMKDELMKSEENPYGIEVIYIENDYATKLEAKGLYVFASLPQFAQKAKEFRSNDKN